MASSILKRKCDLVYLIFFCIHIPVIFFVDCAPLWPASIKPAFVDTLRKYYISTFRDQFFTHPPAWFDVYTYMELVYHVPVSLWAIGALLRDDPMVPAHLVVFAMQTATTTLTCVVEFMSWEDYVFREKILLAQLYVPYLALAVFMGLDMFARLRKQLKRGVPVADNKKLR